MVAIIYIMSSLKNIRAISKGIFSAADAKAVGVSPRVLHYLCVQGKINRVGHGFYDVRTNIDLSIEALIRDTLVQIGEAVSVHENSPVASRTHR